MSIAIEFTLNGRPCRSDTPPHFTVLDLLRDGLSLTGTKDGCGEGVCGACTVLLDGQPIRACLVLAVRLAGRALVTIEGLEGEALDPLQEAFAMLGAAQCGFCTPGMILSARALLASNPAPTVREVREALAGNLCRCTGYVKIVQAVLAAARSRSSDGVSTVPAGASPIDCATEAGARQPSGASGWSATTGNPLRPPGGPCASAPSS